MTLKSKILLLLTAVFFPLSSLIADDVHPIMKFFGMGRSPLSTITPANGVANEINDLYALLGWVGLGIFLVVFIVFAFIVYKFRESKNAKPVDSHGNTLLEIICTAIPLIILIVIAVPTIRLIFKMEKPLDLKNNKTVEYTTYSGDIKQSNRYLEINAIGHQWWWEFEFVGYWVRNEGETEPKLVPLNKKVGANEIWLPLHIPIKFNITSEDVIHSFWVPRLMGKVDALPGQINFMTFVIDKEGYYYGVCAEYCGASHALMRFNLVGVTEEKFNAWANWGQGNIVTASESAEKGKLAFQTCLGCHTLDGIRPFEPRQERLDKAMAEYVDMKKIFTESEKIWREDYLKDKDGHVFFREILENPDRPVAPVKPRLFQGIYRTVAPDLSDFRFRKRMLASIYETDRERLKEWIENPPAIKPEMANTPVIRMPVYEHILEPEAIDNIVEFLMTLEYSDSPKMPNIDALYQASKPKTVELESSRQDNLQHTAQNN